MVRFLTSKKQEEMMENTVVELSYALDTLYFLVMGFCYVDCGFTMTESGLVT